MTLQLHAPFCCSWCNCTWVCLSQTSNVPLCPSAEKPHFMRFFAKSLLIFLCLNLKWLTLLPFMAHLCAVGLVEAMNTIPRKVGGDQRAGLNKSTQSCRTGSPSPKKEFERELGELTWQTVLIFVLYGWASLEGARARCYLGSPPAIVSLCSTLGVHKNFNHRETIHFGVWFLLPKSFQTI